MLRPGIDPAEKKGKSLLGVLLARTIVLESAERCLKTMTATGELVARCCVGALGRGICYSRKGSVGKEEQKHGERDDDDDDDDASGVDRS